MTTYDPKSAWTKAFVGSEMPYPSEYVIRIFKGSYPKLNLDKASFPGKKICDVGCGEGRQFPLLSKCGFDLYGVEITGEIVNQIRANLAAVNVPATIAVGDNGHIPFPDGMFDYLLSWNACYYMGETNLFEDYVKEFARALKSGGTLVLSIPKKTSFIFEGSDVAEPGYRIIRRDPFNMRNGERLRYFEDEAEIERAFAPAFSSFVFGSIDDNCFGLEYRWHMAVCTKV